MLEVAFLVLVNLPFYTAHQVHAGGRVLIHGAACSLERVVGKKCKPLNPPHLPRYEWKD